MKNQITKGNWLVRNVEYVDDEKRQICFEAGGIIPGQDPYFTQLYRINFDGTGLTKLTDADGMHTVTFSKDHKYYVDTWQRVDLAPIAQLRRTSDQTVVMDLDKGDTSALLAAGFRFPEVFVAKGRDGKTEIWGTITRPTELRPFEEVPGHREHLCRSPGLVCTQDLQRSRARPGTRRTRIYRRAHRRDGHQQPLQGLPRCGLQEPWRRWLSRPHPLAQGRGGKVSLLRHLARGHLRHVGRRAEFARRRSVPS